MKIRKGDMVKVIAGKDKGKTGRVLEVDLGRERVLVERVNFAKRHQRPSQRQRQGGIIEKERPLHISNVMYYDEKAGKATRIGARMDGEGKVRIAKRTGEVIAGAKV